MQRHFGMKIRVDADIRPGLPHAVPVMPAYTSAISQLPHLIREDDRAEFGGTGYADETPKRLPSTVRAWHAAHSAKCKDRPDKHLCRYTLSHDVGDPSHARCLIQGAST